RVLLRQKQYAAAYVEFHRLALNAPGNVSFKVGLADALIGLATADNRTTDATRDIKTLHHARRVAREANALDSSDPAPLARLAMAQLILSLRDKPSLKNKALLPDMQAEQDKQSFLYHAGEALAAWNKLVALDKAGLLAPLKPEMESPAALKKAGLSES